MKKKFLKFVFIAFWNKILFYNEITFSMENIDNPLLSILLKPIFCVLWIFEFGVLPCLIFDRLEFINKTSKYILCFLPGFGLIFLYDGYFSENVLWNLIFLLCVVIICVVLFCLLLDNSLENQILILLLKKFNIDSSDVNWWIFLLIFSYCQSIIVVECFFKAGSY